MTAQEQIELMRKTYLPGAIVRLNARAPEAFQGRDMTICQVYGVGPLLSGSSGEHYRANWNELVDWQEAGPPIDQPTETAPAGRWQRIRRFCAQIWRGEA